MRMLDQDDDEARRIHEGILRTMQHNGQSNIAVSVWMTLDGVFDADTMDQWFTPYDSKDRQQYIKETIFTADAFLFGRATYQMLAPYWSPQPDTEKEGIAGKMNTTPKYVVTSTLEAAQWKNSTIIHENAVEAITTLKQQPGHDIQIPGSATLVQSLMATDLIDEYRFLVHPIVIGSGKHFFKEAMNMTKLKLVKTQTLAKGVVLLCYQRAQR